ncbi:MAG: formyltransferase family protein [Gammaproteobacteria bacterium]|nr:formyltransferase family protein [Gammaproteobacteria bacterium]
MKNIVYIGSQGVLSVIPLRVLLQAGVAIKAIAVLAETRCAIEARPAVIADIKVGDEEALSSSESLLDIADKYQIPVIELAKKLEQSVGALQSIGTDLILMSCFSRRLPAEIFELPKFGCFNLHPSVLPAYRGPSPVHWQCAHNVTESGVTIHQVNAGFDEGDIAIQKKVKMRYCVNKVELGYKLALLGGEAFVELLQQIENNTLELLPQAESAASYYGFPD